MTLLNIDTPNIQEIARKFRLSLWIAAAFTFALSFQSCKSSKGVHRDNSHSAASEAIHVKKPNRQQARIIDEAYSWVGTPYKYACAEKGKGTDCSGMVMKVYEEAAGQKIPRNSAKQAEFCDKVDAEHVSTGDLVFFATGKDPHKVSHVGIVVDNEKFIHASSSKGVVVSNLFTPYYQRKFLMFGRVPGLRADK